MKYIFGPVPSRRLGSSLGIEVVPHKICNFDCLYCEVGKTNKLTIKRDRYINIEEMLNEFKIKYTHFQSHIDVITITGAGEPTLNSDLQKIIQEIKKISKHPVALLTNSTMIDNKDVQDALMEIDILVPSVDAISIDIVEKLNKPHKKLDWEKALDALKHFSHKYQGDMFIEILLVKGLNDTYQELSKIAEYINELKYTKVQLNTVYGPPAYTETKGLADKELLEIMFFFAKKGLKVEPVGNFIKEINSPTSSDLVSTITSLLRMRPCTLQDLKLIFSSQKNELEAILNSIEKIEKSSYNGELYYMVKDR